MSDSDEKIKQETLFGATKESAFKKHFAHAGEKEIPQTEDTERQKNSENNDSVSVERSMSQTADSIIFKYGKQVTVLPYGYLRRADMTEKGDITINYIGTEIIIKGKNLFPLLEAIARKKAYLIQENNPKHDNEEETKIWIDEIIISDAK